MKLHKWAVLGSGSFIILTVILASFLIIVVGGYVILMDTYTKLQNIDEIVEEVQDPIKPDNSGDEGKDDSDKDIVYTGEGDYFDQFHAFIMKNKLYDTTLTWDNITSPMDVSIYKSVENTFPLKYYFYCYALFSEICLRDEINPKSAYEEGTVITPGMVMAAFLEEGWQELISSGGGYSNENQYVPTSLYSSADSFDEYAFSGFFGFSDLWNATYYISDADNVCGYNAICLYISKFENSVLSDDKRAIYGSRGSFSKNISTAEDELVYLCEETYSLLSQLKYIGDIPEKYRLNFNDLSGVNTVGQGLWNMDSPGSSGVDMLTEINAMKARPSIRNISDASYTWALLFRLYLNNRNLQIEAREAGQQFWHKAETGYASSADLLSLDLGDEITGVELAVTRMMIAVSGFSGNSSVYNCSNELGAVTKIYLSMMYEDIGFNYQERTMTSVISSGGTFVDGQLIFGRHNAFHYKCTDTHCYNSVSKSCVGLTLINSESCVLDKLEGSNYMYAMSRERLLDALSDMSYENMRVQTFFGYRVYASYLTEERSRNIYIASLCESHPEFTDASDEDYKYVVSGMKVSYRPEGGSMPQLNWKDTSICNGSSSCACEMYNQWKSGGFITNTINVVPAEVEAQLDGLNIQYFPTQYQTPEAGNTYTTSSTLGTYEGHNGLDICYNHDNPDSWGNTEAGTNIYAIDDAVVYRINVRNETLNVSAASLGSYVILYHGDGYYSVYSHLSGIAHLSCGDIIKAGSLIGYAGNTGSSLGVHLHLALFYSSSPLTLPGSIEITTNDGYSYSGDTAMLYFFQDYIKEQTLIKIAYSNHYYMEDTRNLYDAGKLQFGSSSGMLTYNCNVEWISVTPDGSGGEPLADGP